MTPHFELRDEGRLVAPKPRLDLRGEGGLVSPKPRLDLRGEGGFTLIEMLVASGIMLAVTAAVFQLMNPAQGVFKAQPEVADLQQRLA